MGAMDDLGVDRINVENNDLREFFDNVGTKWILNPFVLPNLEPKCAPGDPILYPESIFCYSP